MTYKFKTPPYPHQLEAFERSKDQEAFAFWLEMGLGKTKLTIDTAAYLYDRGLINGLVVVAPKGVHENWVINELPTHLPDHIYWYAVAWDSATSHRADVQDNLRSLLQPTDMLLKVLTINVDALLVKRAHKLLRYFLMAHRCLMVVDESVVIKGDSKRTEAAIQLGRLAAYRRILSGLPTPNSPLDLFHQCEFLAPGLLGTGSFFAFRNRYAVLEDQYIGHRRIKKVVGYQNLDELNRRLAQFSYRATKAECLNLPDKIYQRRYVTLTVEQRRLYESLRKEAVVLLQGAELITTEMVLQQIMKLHQITCGHVKDDDGRVHRIDSNRVKIMLELLEDHSGAAIVWCHYREDVRLVTEALTKGYGQDQVAVIWGDTPGEQRSSLVAEIQDGTRRFLVATKAAARGITLTAANLVIYYSNGYDLDTRAQSEDRCHRIGQKNAVTYVDLVARGTLDERILEALRNKQNLADVVVDGKNWKALLS